MSLLTVEQQLRTYLLAQPAIAAALPGGLYHVQLPQSVPTYPAATYQRVSTQRNYVHGQNGQYSDMGWMRFQLDVWSNTETAATDVINAGLLIMQAVRTFNAYSQSGPGSNRVLQERVQVEPDTQPPMFRYMMDIQVWFSDNT